MEHTGIVRKIDELGRIVLPKELRTFLNINPGDDFEIIIENDKILLNKHSRLRSIESELLKIIDCFNIVLKETTFITINNKVINLNNEEINSSIQKKILDRRIYQKEIIEHIKLTNNITLEGRMIINPIVINSDLLGGLIVIGQENIEELTKTSKIIMLLIKKYFV